MRSEHADDQLTRFRHYRSDGGRELRNRLVEEHLELVEHYVRRYRGRSVTEDDLRQVAGLALVQAVERFDPDVGVMFETYAGRTIDGTIKRHFRDRTWAVRPPRRAQELYLEVRQAEEELGHALGRSPTVAETAAHLGLSQDEILEGSEAAGAYRSDSLDHPAPGVDDGSPIGEQLPSDERGHDRSEIRVLLDRVMGQLPDRERDALRMRYVEEMTQSEIAAELAVSQSYLSRLLRQALGHLRELIEE